MGEREELAELRREVAELRSRLDRVAVMEARLDRIEARPSGDSTLLDAHVVDGPSDDLAPPGTSDGSALGGTPTIGRRGLLQRGAAAAAGVVAGSAALALADARPASAAVSYLALDTTNSSSLPTILNMPGPGATDSNVLTVLDANAPGNGQSFAPAAVTGQALGNRVQNGVLGTTDVAGGSGVIGWCLAMPGSVALRARAGGARAHLALDPAGPAAPARSDAHEQGDVLADSTGTLWLCTAGGTPGTFVRLGAAGGAGALTMLPSPVRVYDSRVGQPPTSVGPKTPLGPGVPRTVDMTLNGSGVPVGANAVLVNATIVPVAPVGFLALYKPGIAYPGTSTLNWSSPAKAIANSTVVAMATGSINVFAYDTTDVIIDVIGYYQ